jgi:hypothetical protein
MGKYKDGDKVVIQTEAIVVSESPLDNVIYVYDVRGGQSYLINTKYIVDHIPRES